jgi:hypothetical protein
MIPQQNINNFPEIAMMVRIPGTTEHRFAPLSRLTCRRDRNMKDNLGWFHGKKRSLRRIFEAGLQRLV